MDSERHHRGKNTAAERIIRRKIVPYLPEDIIINVVSRLPADDVLRCRCVCKAWRDLTSTQEFLEIHRSREVTAPPSILVDIPWECPERARYFIDNWWEPTETVQKSWLFANFPEHRVVLSHGGLILLRSPSLPQQFIILNPINDEYVIIMFVGNMCDTCNKYEVYGVYFHPVIKEYCALWGSYGNFKLLVLGSTPYVKDLSNPLWWKKRAVDTPPPILVNDNLYWMVAPEGQQTHCDFIEYDVKREEFVLLPSTVPRHFISSYKIGLLNIDGLVSVVRALATQQKLVITIFTLKDRPGKIWKKSAYSFSTQGHLGYWSLRPIAFAKDELFLCSDSKIFICNLKSKTMRSFQSVNFDDRALFVSHVKTFASLRNSKPEAWAERTRIEGPLPQTIESREVTDETRGGRIQIIWKQLKRAQAQKRNSCIRS